MTSRKQQVPNGRSNPIPPGVIIKIEDDDDQNKMDITPVYFGRLSNPAHPGTEYPDTWHDNKATPTQGMNPNHAETIVDQNAPFRMSNPQQRVLLSASRQSGSPSRNPERHPQAQIPDHAHPPQRLSRDIRALGATTRQVTREVERKETGELEKARVEIRALKKQLSDARGHMQRQTWIIEELNDTRFNMLLTEQISDTQIGEQYYLLCGRIEDWIDTELSDLSNVLRMVVNQFRETKRFQAVSKGFLGSPEEAAMKSYQKADYSIMRRFIQRFLDVFFFGKDEYFVALQGTEGEFLKDVEEGMRTLKPPLGEWVKINSVSWFRANIVLVEDAIQTWRSNTLRALSTLQFYQEKRAAYLNDVKRMIAEFLEPFFARNRDSSESMNKFHGEITTPAAELAANLKKFHQKYVFGTTLDKAGNGDNRIFRKGDLKNFTMIDGMTDQAVLTLQFNHLQDRDPIGHEIFVIHPSLMREAKGNHPDIIVSKPVVLVQLYEQRGAAWGR
jgi:hypothetical protein